MVLLVILCCRMFYSLHYNLTVLFSVMAVRRMWMLYVESIFLLPFFLLIDFIRLLLLLLLFLLLLLPSCSSWFLASSLLQLQFGIPEGVEIHMWWRIHQSNSQRDTYVLMEPPHRLPSTQLYKTCCNCCFEVFSDAWSGTWLWLPVLFLNYFPD